MKTSWAGTGRLPVQAVSSTMLPSLLISLLCCAAPGSSSCIKTKMTSATAPEPEPDKRERKDYIENWSERTYKIEKGSWRERTEN